MMFLLATMFTSLIGVEYFRVGFGVADVTETVAPEVVTWDRLSDKKNAWDVSVGYETSAIDLTFVVDDKWPKNRQCFLSFAGEEDKMKQTGISHHPSKSEVRELILVLFTFQTLSLSSLVYFYNVHANTFTHRAHERVCS